MEHKYLALGADGLIGKGLTKELSLRGNPAVETTRRMECSNQQQLHFDLHDDSSSWSIPSGITTAFLVAGITSVEYCRVNQDECRVINVDKTIQLMEKLFASGVSVVFPSTNLVFDGSSEFCRVTEPTSPHCTYGKFKAEVETWLLRSEGCGCIVRFTKVAESLIPLVREWKSLMERELTVEPFYDMCFSPVALEKCVEGMLSLADRKSQGIFHFSGDRDVTYVELCYMCADMLGLSEDLKKSLIKPVSVREKLPFIETVPRHSTLDMNETFEEIGALPQNSLKTLDSLLQSVFSVQ